MAQYWRCDKKSAKYNSPPIFPAIRYVISTTSLTEHIVYMYNHVCRISDVYSARGMGEGEGGGGRVGEGRVGEGIYSARGVPEAVQFLRSLSHS